jgi:hypothetical protein
MNDIITKRTNPSARFKIQGVLLGEKLTKHLNKKKLMNQFLIEIEKLIFFIKRFKDSVILIKK